MKSGRSERICAWSGMIGVALFPIGFWPLMHFLPPPSPSLSALEVAELYRGNTNGIRLGAMLVMFCATLFIPFFGAISSAIRRIEGIRAPYAWSQAIGAALVCVCFYCGPMMLTLTAFRPERAPELTMLLNDMSWFLLATAGAAGFIQTVVIGLAILGDKAPQPLFPRWAGYFSLFGAFIFLPECTAIFFKHGPFAWNGLFPFWLGILFVGAWTNALGFLMIKNSKRTDYQTVTG